MSRHKLNQKCMLKCSKQIRFYLKATLSRTSSIANLSCDQI